MKREDARAMARELMDHHGLREWSLRFDRARRRAGACVHTRREIRLWGPWLTSTMRKQYVESSCTKLPTPWLVPHIITMRSGKRKLANLAPPIARAYRHTCPRLGHRGWGYAQCVEHGGNSIRLPDGSPLVVCVHALLMPRESLSGPTKGKLVNPVDSMLANYAV